MSDNCEHCGARLMGRWERLTPGLVRTLVKFKTAVCEMGVNEINVNQNPSFNHNEKANFQKLRFHGLVARVRDKGIPVPGFWLLTRRGNDFLGGHDVPAKVFIFRNHIEKRDDGGETVTVSRILKTDLPNFDEKNDFVYEEVVLKEDLFK